MNINFRNELITILINDGSLKFGRDFIGKSGKTYACETDLRYSFRTFGHAKSVCKLIYRLITEIHDLPEFDSFLGIPETGTIIANFLNEYKYTSQKKDFSFNCLRVSPKEYQVKTKSNLTVLPADFSRKCLIVEDDVVTGNTLVQYTQAAIDSGINICGALSIFYRPNSLTNSVDLRDFYKDKFGISLYNILIIDAKFIELKGE